MSESFSPKPIHTTITTPDSPEFELKNPKLSKALQEYYDISQEKYNEAHIDSKEWKEIMRVAELLTKATLLTADKETTI